MNSNCKIIIKNAHKFKNKFIYVSPENRKKFGEFIFLKIGKKHVNVF